MGLMVLGEWKARAKSGCTLWPVGGVCERGGKRRGRGIGFQVGDRLEACPAGRDRLELRLLVLRFTAGPNGQSANQSKTADPSGKAIFQRVVWCEIENCPRQLAAGVPKQFQLSPGPGSVGLAAASQP